MMAFILATDFDFIAYMSKMAFILEAFSCQWRFWNMISPSNAINHTTNNNIMINNNNKKCELSLCRLLDSVLVHLPFGPSGLSDVNIIRCRRKENPDIVEVDL